MFDLIEKLRQKPDRVKKQIAFLVALFLSGIIFVLWLGVIYPDFRRDQSKKESISKSEPSPLGTFKQTFSAGAGAIGEKFSNLKEVIYTFSRESFVDTSTTTIEQ